MEGEDSDKNVKIKPAGTFRRGFENDVSSLNIVEADSGSEKTIEFEINRASLYDRLPQGLFHEHHKSEDWDDVEHRSRQLKEEEQAARQFFCPFDQELNHYRLLIELEERKELFGFSENRLRPALLKFWGLNLKDFSPKQASILCYLLPNAHKITGNIGALKVCYQAVLGTNVAFESKPAKPVNINMDTACGLGAASLGDDFIIGQDFDAGNKHFCIRVGPIPGSRVPEFLPSGKAQKVISYLNEHFIPFDWDISMKIEIKDQYQRFCIADASDQARLGITTTI
ncbi:type VI secretion system baseplate subunit TssG [candidate division KSB1 bacterium]|nr:type VI secretion system baseplate subunit TssG [candidate division KSB1 bacterium]